MRLSSAMARDGGGGECGQGGCGESNAGRKGRRSKDSTCKPVAPRNSDHLDRLRATRALAEALDRQKSRRALEQTAAAELANELDALAGPHRCRHHHCRHC